MLTKSTLYVVATPIGNLEDITYRAVRILKSVDCIAAEDTRQTRKLLAHYQISRPLVSYHEHNERSRAEMLVTRLQQGEAIALVSDAGTPLVADPGYRLICRLREVGISVVPIPGPSAVLAALMASGLPTDCFYFAGFPSPKAGRKRRFLEGLVGVPATLIFFESPYRLATTLALMSEVFGERPAVVARELTKLHEEFLRGSLAELSDQVAGRKKVYGEVVILVAGAR